MKKAQKWILGKTQKQKICFLKTLQDSRISKETCCATLAPLRLFWEIESVLFKPRAEIRLECLSTQRGVEIADSSPKAESTKRKKGL